MLVNLLVFFCFRLFVCLSVCLLVRLAERRTFLQTFCYMFSVCLLVGCPLDRNTMYLRDIVLLTYLYVLPHCDKSCRSYLLSFPNHGCLFLLDGCLPSQQHASVSQGRICSHNCTCCHTEIKVADQTFHLTQS